MGGAVEDRERVFRVGEVTDAGGGGVVLGLGRWSDVGITEEGKSSEEGGRQGHGWWRGDIGISGIVRVVGVGLSGSRGGRVRGELLKAKRGFK